MYLFLDRVVQLSGPPNQVDCDSDIDCMKGQVCGINNCKTDYGSINGSSWNWYEDCCTGKCIRYHPSMYLLFCHVYYNQLWNRFMVKLETTISMRFIEIPTAWFTRTWISYYSRHTYVKYGSYSRIDEAKIACKNDDGCILVNEEWSSFSLSSKETAAHGSYYGYVNLKGKHLSRQIKYK